MLIRCECGWEKTVKDDLLGKKAECPKCGARFVLSPADSGSGFAPPAVATPKPAVLQTIAPPPLPAIQVTPKEVRTPTTHVTVQQRSSSAHSLGTSSIVLGILGLLICWIPLIGLLGSPLSALGLLLGGVGLLLALFRSGSGLGYSIAGTAISGLALAVCLVINLAIASPILLPAIDQAQKAAERTREKQMAREQGLPEPAAATEAVATAAAVPKPVPSKVYEDDTVRIAISEVRQGRARVNYFGDKFGETKEDRLLIHLTVTNKRDDLKMELRGWHTTSSFEDDRATLKDDLGNSYDGIGFGTARVEGQSSYESVYPGKDIGDLVVFETPIPKASTLFLTLNAIGIKTDRTEPYELAFPTDDIVRDEAPAPE